MSRQDRTGLTAVSPARGLELVPTVSFAGTWDKTMPGSGYLGSVCTSCAGKVSYPIDAP